MYLSVVEHWFCMQSSAWFCILRIDDLRLRYDLDLFVEQVYPSQPI